MTDAEVGYEPQSHRPHAGITVKHRPQTVTDFPAFGTDERTVVPLMLTTPD